MWKLTEARHKKHGFLHPNTSARAFHTLQHFYTLVCFSLKNRTFLAT